MNTGLPPAALPFGPRVGSFPTTVSGVGVVTFLPPGTVLEQPTSRAASTASEARRRTAASLVNATRAPYNMLRALWIADLWRYHDPHEKTFLRA